MARLLGFNPLVGPVSCQLFIRGRRCVRRVVSIAGRMKPQDQHLLPHADSVICRVPLDVSISGRIAIARKTFLATNTQFQSHMYILPPRNRRVCQVNGVVSITGRINLTCPRSDAVLHACTLSCHLGRLLCNEWAVIRFNLRQDQSLLPQPEEEKCMEPELAFQSQAGSISPATWRIGSSNASANMDFNLRQDQSLLPRELRDLRCGDWLRFNHRQDQPLLPLLAQSGALTGSTLRFNLRQDQSLCRVPATGERMFQSQAGSISPATWHRRHLRPRRVRRVSITGLSCHLPAALLRQVSISGRINLSCHSAPPCFNGLWFQSTGDHSISQPSKGRSGSLGRPALGFNRRRDQSDQRRLHPKTRFNHRQDPAASFSRLAVSISAGSNISRHTEDGID